MKMLAIILSGLLFSISISSAHQTTDSVTVTVDETGFSPSTLTIDEHTKVQFHNIGDAEHWPASDRHPNHTDYSGSDIDTHCAENYTGPAPFDSCGGIQPDQTWSHTFETTGTYHFHDHIWSHLGGTIVVVGEEKWWQRLFTWITSWFRSEEPVQAELLSGGHSEVIHELEVELVEIVKSSDPGKAIQALTEAANAEPEIQAQCHDLLHEIGQASYDKYDSFETAVVYNTDYCNSGYIHGLFEAYFESTSPEEIDLAALCSGDTTPRLFDSWQCYHGIGHGLMYHTGGDLDAALVQCNNLPEKTFARQCANGVYMELFNNEVLALEPTFLNPVRPSSVCEDMNLSQSDCYFYSPTYFTQVLETDIDTAFASCDELQSSQRKSCIAGAGAETRKRNARNLEAVFQTCDRFTFKTNSYTCVGGIASMSVFQTASIETALSQCSYAGKYQDHCEETVQAYELMFTETQ